MCLLLSDRANVHLQRDGWIAWGALRLDGKLGWVDEPLVNDLGPVPCVGRIWDPADRIPKPHEDAVMSLVQVADLQQAWDAITYFAGAEATILEEVVLGPGS